MSLFESKKMAKQTAGVTLTEFLLVMVIAFSILLLGVRQYFMFQRDADMRQVLANVDTLAQAAAGYYKANCKVGGTLDPALSPPTVFPINITTDLINGGFVTLPIPANRLVNNTAPGNGYAVQLNQTVIPKLVCTAGTNATGVTAATGCTATTQVGSIIAWKIQISVLLLDSLPKATFVNALAGDCLTTLMANNVTAPCNSAGAFNTQCQSLRSVLPADPNFAASNALANSLGCPASAAPTSYNNYIAFERLPSYATPVSTSGFWQTNATVQQFNQMYTTYPMTYLTTQTPSGQTPSGQQNYLCGG